MPKRKRGSGFEGARKKREGGKKRRENETPEEQAVRLEEDRTRAAERREEETPTERETRLAGKRERDAAKRNEETAAEREARLTAMKERDAAKRNEETAEEREARLTAMKQRVAAKRNEETAAEREARLTAMKEREVEKRQGETAAETEARLEAMRERKAVRRDGETSTEREARLLQDRLAKATGREGESEAEKRRRLTGRRVTRVMSDGLMSKVCPHCSALKFPSESDGMCCNSGKVVLPHLQAPPEPLLSLTLGHGEFGKHFRKNIRGYNSAFCMTSIGMKEAPLRDGKWMPCIRIQGAVHHLIGSLLPSPGEDPKFCQVYFHDREVHHRQSNFRDLKAPVLQGLQEMLHQHNARVKEFKTAVEILAELPDDEKTACRIKIHHERRPPGEHERRYNEPTVSEVALLLPEENATNPRDVILRGRDSTLHRISEIHPSYDPYQYPLLLPHGEFGWSPDLKMQSGKRLTACDFASYHLMTRPMEFHMLLRGGKLTQQYVVDQYAKIECQRLKYIEENQTKLRADAYNGLRDAVHAHDDAENIGHRVILPSTFVGGPRYMHENQQDAMAYCQTMGKPDEFLTLTCNANWPEISANLFPGQTASDRPDIVARAFEAKVKQFIQRLQQRKRVQAYSLVVEWQKRGLPHCHTVQWYHPDDKPRPRNYDDHVCAEIPDRNLFPERYEMVLSFMIHGPCGAIKPNSPCMKNGKCKWGYPKSFQSETRVQEDGYPLYRRRSPLEGGQTATIYVSGKGEIEIHNGWVVPYPPDLMDEFGCHINIEICATVKAIKYVISYLHKGSDQAIFSVEKEGPESSNSEVRKFLTARYLGPAQAAHHIFKFPIHRRSPPVTRLPVHRENEQRVFFTAENAREVAEHPPQTPLTSFFRLCQNDEFARGLLYRELPQYYTLDSKKEWHRRRRGTRHPTERDIFSENNVGRVYNVSPRQGELFYLRLLLQHVRGPTSFQFLKTVEGDVLSTYRDACMKRNLLENDQHWTDCMQEVASARRPSALRRVFALILVFGDPSDPAQLWENHKGDMAEDFAHKKSPRPEVDALLAVSSILGKMGGKETSDYGLPQVESVHEETVESDVPPHIPLPFDVTARISKLNEEQRNVFQFAQNQLSNGFGGLLFVDAPGGTGKTFLLNTILGWAQESSIPFFSVASSGIAATLLHQGRTAHSTFLIPLELKEREKNRCAIPAQSKRAKEIRNCRLIIWDEAPMAHRLAVEAVDRTVRDITGKTSSMGGIFTIFCGDFRQILPVIPKGTPADIVASCLKSSYLWKDVKTMHLTRNMRVRQSPEAGEFSDFLLALGSGTLDHDSEDTVEIPARFCCPPRDTLEQFLQDYDFLDQRSKAVIAPTNSLVHEVNTFLLDRFGKGDAVTYLSIDSVEDEDDATRFQPEFLNRINPPGLPVHELKLKVGCPVMVIRNLDPPYLCNGTMCSLLSLRDNSLEIQVVSGPHKGHRAFVPRIPLITNPNESPVIFRRLQFPVRVCFALTINKAQGQTFDKVWLYLKTPPFTHGMLYVAMSRCTDPRNLRVWAPEGRVRNTVFRCILSERGSLTLNGTGEGGKLPSQTNEESGLSIGRKRSGECSSENSDDRAPRVCSEVPAVRPPAEDVEEIPLWLPHPPPGTVSRRSLFFLFGRQFSAARRGWLDDEMINFFQGVIFQLLNSPCGGAGYQDVLLGVHTTFRPCRRRGQDPRSVCVHLLPAGNFALTNRQSQTGMRDFVSNHWVCTVLRGGHVEVLDSLSARTSLNAALSVFLREVYGADLQEVLLVDTKQQRNGSDCGVHAIANGIMTALGHDMRVIGCIDEDIPDVQEPATTIRRQLSRYIFEGNVDAFPCVSRTQRPDVSYRLE